MAYVKVMWPESQALMSLTDEEMDEYGIELGDDCSYFVPEEDYDEIFKLAETKFEWMMLGGGILKHYRPLS